MSSQPNSLPQGFPTTRMRRCAINRRFADSVRQTRLSPANLVLPLSSGLARAFVKRLPPCRATIKCRSTSLSKKSATAADLGIGGVILFGIPAEKDALGSDATSDCRHHRSGGPRREEGRPRFSGHHRRLLLRIHRSWALRSYRPSDRPDGR